MDPMKKRTLEIIEELLLEEETLAAEDAEHAPQARSDGGSEDGFEMLIVAIVSEMTPAKIKKVATGMSLTDQEADAIRRCANRRVDAWPLRDLAKLGVG